MALSEIPDTSFGSTNAKMTIKKMDILRMDVGY